MAEDDLREDDIVYFMRDTSTHSWAGVIDDSIDMTDEAVNEYIKDTNPKLFTKLRGMKFGSSDIPLTFKPQHDLRRLENMEKETLTRAQQNQHSANPAEDTVEPTNETHLTINRSQNGIESSDAPPAARIYEPTLTDSQQQLKLDGIDRQTIQSSAERLYPRLSRPTSVPPSYHNVNVAMRHASSYRTNSKTAHKLRALKQLEMDEILSEVSKYEKALEIAKARLQQLKTHDPSPDASVLITRPLYMEPRKDRYKKQGLTRYDREKQRKALRESDFNSKTATSFPVSEATTPWALDERYCYCREPDDGTEMVRCSKQWCPVGWFHLRCTGLDRLPFIFEEFYCAYCADGLAPPAAQDVLEGGSDGKRDPDGVLVTEDAQLFEDGFNSTRIVETEQHDPRASRLPYQIRVNRGDNDDYGDEGQDGQNTQDGMDNVEANAADPTLRDKIIKWRTINGPHGEGSPGPTRYRSTTTSPLESVFTKATEIDQQYIDEELEESGSEASTIQVSSTIIATYSDHSANFAEDEQSDDTEGIQSCTTIVESIEKDDRPKNTSLQPFQFDPVNPKFPIFNESIRSAYHLSTPRFPETLQPSTITDSVRCAGTRSISSLTSQRSNPVTNPHQSVFDNTDTIDCLRTPSLSPRVATAKSKRPWGTPVNIRDFILEPTSPSPAGKRKFSELGDEAGQKHHDDMTAATEPVDADLEIPDS